MHFRCDFIDEQTMIDELNKSYIKAYLSNGIFFIPRESIDYINVNEV